MAYVLTAAAVSNTTGYVVSNRRWSYDAGKLHVEFLHELVNELSSIEI